ncbi:MAG: hypothetical protein J5614_01790, partial [Paludibacteraceae bacterium]|nr:hypothetical protein [Paludibacteraceae bacterium]
IPPDTFLFSVNDTLQVCFAPGNLQYNDYYFEWRFAENQYDLIGISNSNIAPFYDGWIDLFGWATCGWSTGFLPTSTSTDYRDYLVGGSWDNSFVGDFATADWGALNKIGSDAEHTWRTPTSKEWNYLLAERRNADQLFALATVANVKGLILLPDNWKTPEGVKFIPSVSTEINNHLVYQNGLYMDEEMLDDHYADNTYNEAEWTVMEKSGAIFLPAGGRRWGNTIKNYPTNPWGIYWSSTTGAQEREGNVRALSFYMSGVTPLAETSRVWGCSVRLIQEITSIRRKIIVGDN